MNNKEFEIKSLEEVKQILVLAKKLEKYNVIIEPEYQKEYVYNQLLGAKKWMETRVRYFKKYGC